MKNVIFENYFAIYFCCERLMYWLWWKIAIHCKSLSWWRIRILSFTYLVSSARQSKYTYSGTLSFLSIQEKSDSFNFWQISWGRKSNSLFNSMRMLLPEPSPFLQNIFWTKRKNSISWYPTLNFVKSRYGLSGVKSSNIFNTSIYPYEWHWTE